MSPFCKTLLASADTATFFTFAGISLVEITPVIENKINNAIIPDKKFIKTPALSTISLFKGFCVLNPFSTSFSASTSIPSMLTKPPKGIALIE